MIVTRLEQILDIVSRGAPFFVRSKEKMVKQLKTDNRQPDLWGIIDEVEKKYSDLIDELEGDDPRQPRHPKMKITGMSIREIPRIQEKRRGKKK